MALTIDYFLSLNSPWTHLGAARFTALAAKHGGDVRIFPVDFGAIFAATGGLPLPRRSPQRQAYRMQELARWRDYLKIPIILKPRHFPANETLAAHAVIALREAGEPAKALALAHRVLKALWEEEGNTADPALLATLAEEVGAAGEALIARAAAPGWAELRARETEAAIARGVFGAPSYVVGDEIFWGQDRIDLLARRLAIG